MALRTFRIQFLLGACAATLVGGPNTAPSHAQESRGPAPAVSAALVDLESAVTAAIERNEKSLVSVICVRGLSDQATVIERPFDPFARDQVASLQSSVGDSEYIPNDYGTGVVIDAAGLILTAYHVVDDESAQYYVTTVGRKTMRAQIKGADPRSDLAVLQVQAQDLTPIVLGDGEKVRRGQFVIALGNPYAIARDGQVSASWGIVANVNRKVGATKSEKEAGIKSYYMGGMIQTDARLNLGTSGGALLNLKGEMVGLTTSLAAVSGYEQAAGYAIPVDTTFRRIVETLSQGREVEYGFLGVGPNDLSLDERSRGKHGARVDEVVPGTPAAKAGLRPQDVITSVNGVEIMDRDGLFFNIGNQPVESIARLIVQREGDTVPLNVELAKSPVLGRKIVTSPTAGWRGVRVDYATAVPEFRERIVRGVGYSLGNVLAVDVEFDSAAAKAGLRAGAIITHVDGVHVQTPREFYAAVKGKPGNVQIRMADAELPEELTVGAGED